MLQETEHTIRLVTAYGQTIESEQVAVGDFAAALRRFKNSAITRANSVVVLDGITHTRNTFLEFVREFDDTAARAAYRKP